MPNQPREPGIQSKGLRWSAAGISVMTATSRILGYVRDQLQARWMGTANEADAFFIAFLIPNMLRRLVGEGALTAAFIPVYTRRREAAEDEDPWRLARVVMADLLVILGSLTVLGVVLAPWIVRVLAPGFLSVPGKYELTVLLNRWMFPFIFFIGAAALSMAILNSHRVFVWPSAMPIFFNLSIIASALIFARRWPRPSYAFALGVVAGGAVQFLFQWPALKGVGFTFRFEVDFRHPGVREIFRLMIPGFFSVGIAQVNMVFGQIMASLLGEGAVSSLYYAGRIQELTLGVIAVAYATVLLPHLSTQAARAEWGAYRRTVSEGIVWILTWTVPAMVGLMWIPHPIIHTLFQYGKFDLVSRQMTVAALIWYALGIPAYSMVKVFVPAFYSVKNMWTPIFAAALSMSVYLLGLSVLAIPRGVAGIAMSNSLAAWVQVLYLWIVFSLRRFPLRADILARGALRLGFSLAGMGVALWALMRAIPYVYGGNLFHRGSRLGVWILGAALVYFALQWVSSRILTEGPDAR